jgi:hypothetical protein
VFDLAQATLLQSIYCKQSEITVLKSMGRLPALLNRIMNIVETFARAKCTSLQGQIINDTLGHVLYRFYSRNLTNIHNKLERLFLASLSSLV